jgi:hypothetical protein
MTNVTVTEARETLYLTGIPGMRESIQAGMATPVDECKEEPDW